MRFKTFMEAPNRNDPDDGGKWAVVKVKHLNGWVDAPANPLIHFVDTMKSFDGKRMLFTPSKQYKGLWQTYYPTGKAWFFDPSWLTFEDEEEPYLFPDKPE